MDYRPFRIRDGWFCIVDSKMYGPWSNKESATIGYQTELEKALKRKQRKEEIALKEDEIESLKKEDGPFFFI